MSRCENNSKKIRLRIKKLVLFFMLSLILSGLTAFPIESQLNLAVDWITRMEWDSPLTRWIRLAHQGVYETNERYPFIAYGTDWLAFAHLVIAVVFIGPLKDPVRNMWVIEFGLIVCLAVVPMAFIAGEVRGIPVFWRLIDCIFGLIGGAILWRCHCDIKRLKEINLKA
jgi:hypothetical protein